MTIGYAKMLQDMGVKVDPPRMWPIEWVDFRFHPCPHWLGVEHYREDIRAGREIHPVVLCKQCFTVLDGWHRMAAYWLEGCKEVPVQFAERHLAGDEEACKMAKVDWVKTLRPFAELGCVSGSYHERDWNVPAFSRVRDQLLVYGRGAPGCPTMRLWERVRTVSFLGVLRGKKLLDIGTRESRVPHWCSSQGAKVDILEVDTSQVYRDRRVHIVQGDVQHMPKTFEDDMYDIVTCVAVLKGLDGWDDRRAVKEMMRVLKPGGLLAITVDYGQEYLAFPSKVTGVRLYDKASLYSRIITPSRGKLQGPVDFDRSDWNAWPIRHQSPVAFNAGLNVQVAFILLKKVE